MSNIKQLIRKNIKALKPYKSAREEHSKFNGILLDANENSTDLVEHKGLNRYPDPSQRKLKAKIAKLKGLLPEQIFLGNGSDEAIDLIIRAFCNPGKDRIIIMPPTYGMYSVCAAINDIKVNSVALNNNFQIETSKLFSKINSLDKLLFICSPNNPTGNCFDDLSIKSILNEFPGIVIIDEAYIDFSNRESWLSKLNKYENLIILQTFSKAWGLANIRLGMAFASPVIIEVMNKIKYPYNVNGLTLEIAFKSLLNKNHKEKIVRQILNEKKILETELNLLPFVEKIFPSDANFLLVKMNRANSIYNYLLENNILVRNRTNEIHCENCLRITVGTPHQNKKLLKVLKNYPR